jgi:hypothetical protein
MVTAVPNSLNPDSPAMWPHIRFRFPFPDEDSIEPGAFTYYDRRVAMTAPSPEGVNHRASCEGGDIAIVQQAFRNGYLAPVFQCTGCGCKWWADIEAAAPFIEACIVSGTPINLVIAKRIMAGFKTLEAA